MQLSSPNLRRTAVGLVVLVTALAMAACGSDGADATVTMRLGYFPNLTHATAIAGVEKGFFAEALGPDKLKVSTFSAGPSAVEALFSGGLDASYLGPNPAINAFQRSKGTAIRIISGATSGGAFLVVKPGIADAAALRGRKVASPQLGGTQDVALRSWLGDNGLKTNASGGDNDVSIVPQENAQTLEAFKLGQIDGAWVPEPWATRLVQEGGGKVLVDEATLWPEGQFVTTHLIVRTEFLKDHPATVRRLLAGQIRATEFVNEEPAAAQTVVNAGIEKITGRRLKDEVIRAAWENLEFTNDPIPSSLPTSAEHAEAVGLLEQVDLDGIYDLKLLNEVLQEAGKERISS